MEEYREIKTSILQLNNETFWQWWNTAALSHGLSKYILYMNEYICLQAAFMVLIACDCFEAHFKMICVFENKQDIIEVCAKRHHVEQ